MSTLPQVSTQGSRILVVDDNALNRDMLSRRLERAGFEVDTADGGHAGLERILCGDYALVLLDIMMPDIDGLAVLQRVREFYSKTELPVIMATARDESSALAEALALGANDYVTKPLDFKVVRARLENVLGYALSARELIRTNERLNRDLEAAARVQASLLPQTPAAIKGARFAWRYRPCEELAGDGLNIFRLDDEHVAIYVLDVSGHGVAASLLSVSVTHQLSQLIGGYQGGEGSAPAAEETPTPARLAAKLNSLFPMDAVGHHYFTFLYGVLNTVSREFRFVSAGAPGPLVVHADGSVETHDVPAVPIGMLPDSQYTDSSLTLQAGDRLYLHTDGLYEERNRATREQFGRPRLQALLGELAGEDLDAGLDRLLDSVVQWRGDEDLSDDIAILGCALQD